MLIIRIGWRNLWRNMRRSLIMLGAIVVGLWGLIMIYALNSGFMVGMVDLSIMTGVSSIQVHAKGYFDNPDLKLTMDGTAAALPKIRACAHVTAAAPRVKARAMIMSARGSSGIELIGIDPLSESSVTTVAASMVKGRYLQPGDTGEVIIGEALAEKLKVKPGKKIVVYTRGADLELKALGYKVAGTFDTGTDSINKFTAFVPIEKLQADLALPGKIHEIAVRVDDDIHLDTTRDEIAASLGQHPNLEVLTWKMMYPFMTQMIELVGITNLVTLACVAIAIALGIANTMIMAVFERFRELGIMKAVGTRPFQIFLLIIIESLCLAFTGLVIGTGLGYGTIRFWSAHGLDLSFASRSMSSFGIPTMIYPALYPIDWISTWLVVLGMAVAASIYPAVKAARKNPVEAMRT